MSATPAVSKTKSGKVKIVLDNEMAFELLSILTLLGDLQAKPPVLPGLDAALFDTLI